MLARKYRFHSRGGVRYVYKNGKTIRTPALSLVFTPNTRGYQRFAVVVSKKVLKSAVGRNRIRRRLYEAIRHELPEFKTPMDCVFVVFNQSVTTMPFHKLRRTIHDLISRSLTE